MTEWRAGVVTVKRGGGGGGGGGGVKQIQGIKMEQQKRQKIWENNYEINQSVDKQRNHRAKQRKRQRTESRQFLVIDQHTHHHENRKTNQQTNKQTRGAVLTWLLACVRLAVCIRCGVSLTGTGLKDKIEDTSSRPACSRNRMKFTLPHFGTAAHNACSHFGVHLHEDDVIMAVESGVIRMTAALPFCGLAV